MTTHTLPEAECRTPAPSPAECAPMRTASGSTCESRLAQVLSDLADADRITTSDIAAWDRLQERRA